MKIYITNTSRYDDRAVTWLAKYAARYVHQVAAEIGWVEKLNSHPIALRVTNCSRSYRGRFCNKSYAYAIKNFHRENHGLQAMDVLWDVLVRIGKPENFPVVSTYPRYKGMPEARLENWREAVVGLCAHEICHIGYNYSNHQRKEAEMKVELVEIACVKRFREERALFDAYMESLEQKETQKQVSYAAKQSPEAVAEKKMRDAQSKLKKWLTKQKLANTKVKQYSRLLKRAQKRAEAISGTGEAQ